MPTCVKCGGEAIATKEKSSVTLLGVLGAVVFLVGGPSSCVIVGPLGGGLVALVGLVMGFSAGRERDVLKCTTCRHVRAL